MVIIDTVVNTLFGGLTLDPAGMHCPAGDDAFVSSCNLCLIFLVLLFRVLVVFVCERYFEDDSHCPRKKQFHLLTPLLSYFK